MRCAYSPLAHETLLEIQGPDTLTFLQGQLSCDTRELSDTQAVPGIYCTPKGRTVADLLLIQLGEDHIGLRLRRDICEHTAAVLGKYIVFSKAELQPQADNWELFGCWGEGAGALVTDLAGQDIAGPYACVRGDDFVAVQVDAAGQQFECYGKAGGSLAQRLAEHCEPGTQEAWQALEIARGVARIEAETVEEFIPQMLNYDLTGHISFTKGCYTGQEVVARLHYRGTPKRRTYLGELHSAELPKAGAPLFSAGGAQSVGNVVNVVEHEGAIKLLYCATAAGHEQGVYLENGADNSIIAGELPYSLPAPR